MLGLGIESTAHTFSCAVIKKNGKNPSPWLPLGDYIDISITHAWKNHNARGDGVHISRRDAEAPRDHKMDMTSHPL